MWFSEKISVNSATVKKNGVGCERLEKQSLEFFTVDNKYHKMHYSSSPSTLPQFLSGIVHISWVARYKAFKSVVSPENTFFCLFKRR